MDLQMKRTTQPAWNAMGDHRCEACGSGLLEVVSHIVNVETIRDSVPCICGAQTKAAASSIVQCESRHVRSVPIELYDHPALPEDGVDEWIDRDGGVVQEVVSCRRCAENADWTSSERSTEVETQRFEVACRCGTCGHETEVSDCDITVQRRTSEA